MRDDMSVLFTTIVFSFEFYNQHCQKTPGDVSESWALKLTILGRNLLMNFYAVMSTGRILPQFVAEFFGYELEEAKDYNPHNYLKKSN
jgi:hypothetical protein